jgi:hypothetical protein
MKKAIIALGLIAGALGATSAVAQDRYGNGYGSGYQHYDRDDRGYNRDVRGACQDNRGNRLEQRINQEARAGDIDWRTARELHAMVDRTQDLQRRYCSYGINYGGARATNGAREIDRRYDQIAQRLHWGDNDGWRR